MLLIMLILAFLTTYNGTDNSGIALGTEQCHVGYETTGNPGFFAFCQ